MFQSILKVSLLCTGTFLDLDMSQLLKEIAAGFGCASLELGTHVRAISSDANSKPTTFNISVFVYNQNI